MVSLCVRRTYNKAEREVVLPAVYGGEEEEGLMIRDDMEYLLTAQCSIFVFTPQVDFVNS